MAFAFGMALKCLFNTGLTGDQLNIILFDLAGLVKMFLNVPFTATYK